MIQTITIQDDLFAGYRTRSDFVRHYVFPGGMLPSLARFREEAERAGLKFVEAFRFGSKLFGHERLPARHGSPIDVTLRFAWHICADSCKIIAFAELRLWPAMW